MFFCSYSAVLMYDCRPPTVVKVERNGPERRSACSRILWKRSACLMTRRGLRRLDLPFRLLRQSTLTTAHRTWVRVPLVPLWACQERTSAWKKQLRRLQVEGWLHTCGRPQHGSLPSKLSVRCSYRAYRASNVPPWSAYLDVTKPIFNFDSKSLC